MKAINIADELKKFEGIPTEDMFNVFRTLVSQCSDCKTSSYTFVTGQRIPICEKHWLVAVELDIEWNE